MSQKIDFHYFYMFCFVPVILCAQNDEYQNWSNLGIGYNFSKKTELSIEGGLRSDVVSYEHVQYFSDFSIKRKHNSVVSYLAGFRYASDRKKNGFESKNRFYADFSIKKDLGLNFNVVCRNRFQAQHVLDYYVSKIRQKIKLNYDLKSISLDLYVSLELFYVLDGEFEKTRYVAGLKKSFWDTVDLGVGYMIQKELNTESSDLLYAFRTKILYEF